MADAREQRVSTMLDERDRRVSQQTAETMREMVEEFYAEIEQGISLEVDQKEVRIILDQASSNLIFGLVGCAF